MKLSALSELLPFKMYDLLQSLYFLATGVATYYIFKTDLIYILFAIIALELTYFVFFRTRWNFIKRYVFNIFYAFGYLTPLIFSN